MKELDDVLENIPVFLRGKNPNYSKFLRNKQRGLCFFCGEKTIKGDVELTPVRTRIIPPSRAEETVTEKLQNFVISCQRCQRMKTNLSLDEFTAKIIMIYHNLIRGERGY